MLLNSGDLQVTYCEVYCEVLRDLLSEQQSARLAGAGLNKKGQSGIDVMEANGVMRLKGITPVEVKSMEVTHMYPEIAYQQLPETISRSIPNFGLP